MIDANGNGSEQRILVLAPTEKDAALTQSILTRAGIVCRCFPDLHQLCAHLDAGGRRDSPARRGARGP